MRYNLRIKLRNTTFFMMLSQTQTMKGITSLVKNVKDVRRNKHILMWDLEGAGLLENMLNLKKIQSNYNLGEIFIYGEDTEGDSFRAICFTKKTLDKFLTILLDTPNVDYLFFKYTVMRGKATIRLTDKKGRKKQKILCIVKGREESIPKTMEKVIYDTGLIKNGKTLELVV